MSKELFSRVREKQGFLVKGLVDTLVEATLVCLERATAANLSQAHSLLY